MTDRRSARRAATKDEILAAAWSLARQEGLVGITMRDLGARVGMTAQSLYSYFASKHHIYDAMFEQGYRAFAEWMSAASDDGDRGEPIPAASAEQLVASAHADARRYFTFCVDDPVRFQLLFQRTIPGFVPSEGSYAIAVQVLEQMRLRTALLGVDGDGPFDLWTAVMSGLASQQLANDPGGTRWERLVDDAVDMLLAHTVTTRSPKLRSTR